MSNINLEVRRRDKNIEIKIFSNNNSILIGKNGRTLESLQNIIRQVVHNQIEEDYKIMLDVENYKDKRITNLERLAKRTAREVAKTKIPVKLRYMNAYERKVIHNKLSEWHDVKTHSEGVEPRRYVIVEPKTDEEKQAK